MAKQTMLNNQRKELEDIYNKVLDTNKSEGTLIYNEMLFMLDTLEVLKAEIKQNGATEHFIQGKQNFLRENPSLTAYNKLMKTYDTFYKNLINLLPKEDKLTDNINKDILSYDDFCFEYFDRISSLETTNNVDMLDIEDPKRLKVSEDEYKVYLRDPITYKDKYYDF